MSENGSEKSSDLFHLTIADRFLLLNILPVDGKFARARLAHKLSEVLRFREPELKRYEIEDVVGPDGQTRVAWTKDEAKQQETRSFRIGLSGREMIRKALTDLHDKEKLPPRMVPLYGKFVLDLPKETEEDLVEAVSEGGA